MWKPTKSVLLLLMILMCIFGGLTLSWVDWSIIETGKKIEIYKQIELPIIFLLLAFTFMIPYVKKLKNNN
jgi:hypothetical protein